jgi:hypothetical protein
MEPVIGNGTRGAGLANAQFAWGRTPADSSVNSVNCRIYRCQGCGQPIAFDLLGVVCACADEYAADGDDAPAA